MNNISPRGFALSSTNPSIRIAKRFPASTCIHGISSWKRRDPLSAIREETGSFPFSSSLFLSSFFPRLIASRSLPPRHCPGGSYESFNSIFLPDSALPCNPRRGPSRSIYSARPGPDLIFPPLRDYPEYVQFGRRALPYLLSVIYLRKPVHVCAANGDLCFINVRGTRRSRLAMIPTLDRVTRGVYSYYTAGISKESPKGSIIKHIYKEFSVFSLYEK